MATDQGMASCGADAYQTRTGWAWVVCLSASLYFFFLFIQINLFNAMNPSLIEAFNWDAAQLSQISSSYFYGNVLFLLIAGVVLDRFSTRRVILSGLLLCIVGTLGFALAQGFWQALVSRTLVGVGGAFAFLSNVRLAARWFPPHRLALVIGVIVTVAMLGGMTAQTPLTLLTENYGWREALYLDVALGVLILLIVSLVVQDAPPGYRIEREFAQISALGFWRAIGRAAENPQNWLAGLYTTCMNLPVFLLGALWGNLYLTQAHGLSLTQASWVLSVLFVGLILGSPFFGWLSDRWGVRKRPMVLGALALILLLVVILYVPALSFRSLAILFFLLGFTMGAQVLGYPVIAESNPPALTGTAEGLAATLIMGAGTLQTFVGWMLIQNWDHRKVNQMPLYSLSDFQWALAIMVVGAGLAFLMALYLRETHCQRVDLLDEH